MRSGESPVHDKLIGLLRQSPQGLTTAELAEKMGKTTKAMTSMLSRARLWGKVQKVDQSMHELHRWRLPPP
jgi:hypothetical protein